MTTGECERNPDESQAGIIPEAQKRRQEELDRLMAERVKRLDARAAVLMYGEQNAATHYGFDPDYGRGYGTDNASCHIPSLSDAFRQTQIVAETAPSITSDLRTEQAELQAQYDELRVRLELERTEAEAEKARLDSELEDKRLNATEEIVLIDSELDKRKRLLESVTRESTTVLEAGLDTPINHTDVIVVPQGGTQLPESAYGYQGPVSVGHPDDPVEIQRDVDGNIPLRIPSDIPPGPYGYSVSPHGYLYTPYDVRLSMGQVQNIPKPYRPD